MHKEVAFAFPTPIGKFQVPDAAAVNQELKRLVLERERGSPGETYSNVGGWHSRQDLLEWHSPAVAALRGWIVEAVNHVLAATAELVRVTMGRESQGGMLRLKAWANVCRAGHYHRVHNHPGSAWSGVYYVDAGSKASGHPLSGVLELLDPRPHTEMVATPGDPFGQKVIFRPESGMMVIFPGWLYHSAHPYFGEGERVTVAFNVTWRRASDSHAQLSAP